MDKRRYLKHPENGRVFSWSSTLAGRGDMISCDADGNPLNEDCVMPEAESFKMPNVVHSGVDGWGLGDPEKRKAMDSQINEKIREGNEEWERRNNAPYDGVMVGLPEWVPDRDRRRFKWERNLLLNKYTEQDIHFYMKRYLEFLDSRKNDQSLAELPKEIMGAIDYLCYIKDAMSKAEIDGVEAALNCLVGEQTAVCIGKAETSKKQSNKAKKKRGKCGPVKKLIFRICKSLDEPNIKDVIDVINDEEWLYELIERRSEPLQLRIVTVDEVREVIYLETLTSKNEWKEKTLSYKTVNNYISDFRNS